VAELMSPDRGGVSRTSRRRPLPQRGGFRPVAARLGRLAACRLRRARLRWHRVRPPFRMHRLPSHAADRAALGHRPQWALACQQVPGGRERHSARLQSRLEERVMPLSSLRSPLDRRPRQLVPATPEPCMGMRRWHRPLPARGPRPSQFRGLWRSPCCMNRLCASGRALWTDITDELHRRTERRPRVRRFPPRTAQRNRAPGHESDLLRRAPRARLQQRRMRASEAGAFGRLWERCTRLGLKADHGFPARRGVDPRRGDATCDRPSPTVPSGAALPEPPESAGLEHAYAAVVGVHVELVVIDHFRDLALGSAAPSEEESAGLVDAFCAAVEVSSVMSVHSARPRRKSRFMQHGDLHIVPLN